VAEAEAVRQAGSQADLCLPQHADPWLDHALEQDGIYQPTRSVAEGISKQKKTKKNKKNKKNHRGNFPTTKNQAETFFQQKKQKKQEKTRLKHFSNKKNQAETFFQQKKQQKTKKTLLNFGPTGSHTPMSLWGRRALT
jgi:hypothetical protein